jgi:hypothetical protein
MKKNKTNIGIYAVTGFIGIAIGGIISKLKRDKEEDIDETMEYREESE